MRKFKLSFLFCTTINTPACPLNYLKWMKVKLLIQWWLRLITLMKSELEGANWYLVSKLWAVVICPNFSYATKLSHELGLVKVYLNFLPLFVFSEKINYFFHVYLEFLFIRVMFFFSWDSPMFYSYPCSLR